MSAVSLRSFQFDQAVEDELRNYTFYPARTKSRTTRTRSLAPRMTRMIAFATARH